MNIQTPTLIQAQEVWNGGVIKSTPMNTRFDSSLLNPHIMDAEAGHVIPLLGALLYETMISKKAGTVSNYNMVLGPIQKAFTEVADAAYEALWYRHLNTYIAWCVYYEALPFLTIQTGVNGTFITQTEYSQNPGVSAAKYLQDNVKRRLVIMRETIESYLCANSADLPEYDTSKCPQSGTGCSKEEKTNGKSMSQFGMYYVNNNNNLD